MTPLRERELARLRAMTAAEKVAVLHGLWRQAWALSAAGVRARHPDWSVDAVETEVREIFGRTAP
jgi:hypothetical protein